MQVLVYGVGAIGSFIGGQLLQSGVGVTFVARGEETTFDTRC